MGEGESRGGMQRAEVQCRVRPIWCCWRGGPITAGGGRARLLRPQTPFAYSPEMAGGCHSVIVGRTEGCKDGRIWARRRVWGNTWILEGGPVWLVGHTVGGGTGTARRANRVRVLVPRGRFYVFFIVPRGVV